MTPTTQRYNEAAKRLPATLQPVFERLVNEYRFHTAKHYGGGYVAYQVLADLVLEGWRPTDDLAPPKKQGS